MMNEWKPYSLINQYYIVELSNCKDKPYLVTYQTIRGRRYVAKVNIKNGRLQSKVNGTVVAYMPLPKPYEEE